MAYSGCWSIPSNFATKSSPKYSLASSSDIKSISPSLYKLAKAQRATPEAPDLAITEAAVGAGVTSVIFFVTLKKIKKIDEGGEIDEEHQELD